ncbi:MAG: nodulation protein NfeD [Bdellovibrionales bacterium]|nr:nodulation protein NfeD [Bdellovibrionales bacterium]
MRKLFGLLFLVFAIVPYLEAESPEPEAPLTAEQELYQRADWTILKAPITGSIGPATVHYLKEVFKQLKTTDAQAVVLEINTPGGLLKSTREIIQLINEAPKPVITVVGPSGAQAASAGSFILLAGHWAMMNEGTNTGAASPIDSSGKDIGPTLKKKVFEDTQALMRSLAESRGRNVEMAEKFVKDAISLTDTEALEANVINQRIAGNEDLVKALGRILLLFKDQKINFRGRNISFREVEKRPIGYFLEYIADPQVAYMFTSFGTLGIYIEILGGGLIFPGVFGVICLILGLIALSTLPVNVGFLLLLLFGVVLLGAEVFVSGFGVLGLGGLIAFFLGSLYLFNEPIGGDYMAVVYTITACLGIMFVILTFVLVRKPRTHKSMVGGRAVCASNFINGAGLVQHKGQNVKAISKSGESFKDGDVVAISGSEDDVLIVERAGPEMQSIL